MQQADNIITSLDLKVHPEGGFYKEVYRSEGVIPNQVLPSQFIGDRNYATSIYFLLTEASFSAFHKINQDETWHFYSGAPLCIHIIDEEGNYSSQLLGLDIENGIEPQFTVPAQVWFAAEVKKADGFSFLGCQVAPGFDFADFDLANRDTLLLSFPQHASLITNFTRV